MSVAWALLPFVAVAVAVALAVDYEREQRRKHRARGTYAAQMRRMALSFEECQRQIGEAMMPALLSATAAIADFNTAFSAPDVRVRRYKTGGN